MADLRIKGDVSGYVDLVAPDVAGSTTIDLSKLLVADSSGNVGIGTTSPGAPLEVYGQGTNNYRHIYVNSDETIGGGITLKASGGIDWSIISTGSDATQGTGDLLFYRDATDGGSGAMIIKSDGKVGIGLTTPAAILNVESSVDHASTHYLNTDAQILLQNNNSASTARTVLKLEGSTGGGPSSIVYGGGTSVLTFDDRQNERMRIDSTGNVGMGVTSPSANLDVGGSNTDTSLHLRSGDVNVATGGGNQITFGYNGTTDYRHSIRTRHDSANISNNAFDFYVWQNSQNAADNGNRHVARFDGHGVLTPTSPAFSAVCGSHAVQGDIVFGNANINRGNHYNTSNGRFTAPIAGAYAFMFYGMAENGNTNLRARIYINGASHPSGEHIGGVSYQASGTYQQMILTTILDLNAGDYVNMHWQSNYGAMHSWHNKFSGWLIG